MFKKKETTKAWLESMGIQNYTIHKDLTVDVNGDVDLSAKDLSRIPVQFGIVKGYFTCAQNKLTSLLGSPKAVYSFYCDNNQLTTLKYFPEKVVKNITCSFNKITDLQYLPKKIKGNFDCSNNPLLTTLKNAPQCHVLTASQLNIQFEEYIYLACKVFVHKTDSESGKIQLLKNEYIHDAHYGFELMTYAQKINDLLEPLKEKGVLDKALTKEPLSLTNRKHKL